MLELLSQSSVWERFYEYKTSLVCPKDIERKLRAFIDAEGYIPVCRAIEAGEAFPLPKKSVISKIYTQKKRTVYTYPERENTALKLLTYLLLRKYDGLFAPNLFSFRPGRTAKNALESLLRIPGIMSKYSYKVDVSDYFNSIDIGLFVPELKTVLADDPALSSFLCRLLEEPNVIDSGKIVAERKGIMAGTPVASFYANLYLKDLDKMFYDAGVPYARYSDDIILFADTPEEAEALAERVRAFLRDKGLSVNPKKEEFSTPEEGFTFLGFHCAGGTVDVAPASVKKLKAKMRRKSRALARWRDRNGLEGEKAARAFIRIFNRKLFENPSDSELTWTYWFFPVITTSESLGVIDRYAQDCVRFLVSGKRTKARFNVRYEDVKALGLKSLVHAYYDYSEEEQARRSHRSRLPADPIP
ncbi:MAG: group II intron reverse transcriptase domain-containing protein [Clostridia bacterium]|nr:group II intron reverse transcriptase domain-containing protein [Clostridia bacterium]